MAWATRSSHQNGCDGKPRSHETPPQAAATALLASTAMPTIMCTWLIDRPRRLAFFRTM